MSSAVRDLVDRMFSGSVEGLMMNLLKSEQVDDDRLDELRKMITNREQP